MVRNICIAKFRNHIWLLPVLTRRCLANSALQVPCVSVYVYSLGCQPCICWAGWLCRWSGCSPWGSQSRSSWGSPVRSPATTRVNDRGFPKGRIRYKYPGSDSGVHLSDVHLYLHLSFLIFFVKTILISRVRSQFFLEDWIRILLCNKNWLKIPNCDL